MKKRLYALVLLLALVNQSLFQQTNIPLREPIQQAGVIQPISDLSSWFRLLYSMLQPQSTPAEQTAPTETTTPILSNETAATQPSVTVEGSATVSATSIDPTVTLTETPGEITPTAEESATSTPGETVDATPTTTVEVTLSPPAAETPTATPDALVRDVTGNLIWVESAGDERTPIDWSLEINQKPTVWFQLWRQAEGSSITERVESAKILELPHGTTEVTWQELETKDSDGNVYTYSISQVDADGNELTLEFFTTTLDGLTVTNTYEEAPLTITGADGFTTADPYPAAYPEFFEPAPSVRYANDIGMEGPQTADANGIPTEPGEVTLNKIAVEVEGMVNTYDVTLNIYSRDKMLTSDTVLVLDRSGSMAGTRLESLKVAANSFIDTLLPDNSTSNRVAIVSFASDVATNSNLLSGPGKASLYNRIDGLVAGGGTWTQAGIHAAEEILATSTADKKNIVLLSDGLPTYSIAMTDTGIRSCLQPYTYTDSWGTERTSWESSVNCPSSAYLYNENINTRRVGDGSGLRNYYINNTGYENDIYYNHGNSAIAEAGYAKTSDYTIYTVALEAGAEGTPILNQIASPGYAYNATSQDLQAIFDTIAAEIIAGARQAAVLDPMGTGFIIYGDATAITASQGTTVYDPQTNRLQWFVGDVTMVCPSPPNTSPPDIALKCATLTYRVVLDDNVVSAPTTGGSYQTNGETALTYENTTGTIVEVPFPQPVVDPSLYIISKDVIDYFGNVVDTPGREFHMRVVGYWENGTPNDFTDDTPTGYDRIYVVHPGEPRVLTDLELGAYYTVNEEVIAGTPLSDFTDYDTWSALTTYPAGTIVWEEWGHFATFPTMVDGAPDYELTYFNQEYPLGTLTISKDVYDINGGLVVFDPWNPVGPFTFSISCPPHDGVTRCSDLYGAYIPDTIDLFAGESVTFYDLPYGTYYVDEVGLPPGQWLTSSVPYDGSVTLSVDHKEDRIQYYNSESEHSGLGLMHKEWIGGPVNHLDVCYRPWMGTRGGDYSTYQLMPFTPYRADPAASFNAHEHYHFPNVPLSQLVDVNNTPDDLSDDQLVYMEYWVQEGTCNADGSNFVGFGPGPSEPGFDPLTANNPPGYISTHMNEIEYESTYTPSPFPSTPATYDIYLTNTYIYPYADVTAQKVWSEGPLPTDTTVLYIQLYRSSLATELHAVGSAIPIDGTPDCVSPSTANCEDTPWHFSWTILGQEDDFGNPYTYSANEGILLSSDGSFLPYVPTHYRLSPTSETDPLTGNVALTLTNIYDPPHYTQIRADKTWIGAPSALPLAFRLYRLVSGSTTPEILDTVPAVGDTYTFFDGGAYHFPQYDENGLHYTYWIEEGHFDTTVTPPEFVPVFPVIIPIHLADVWKRGQSVHPPESIANSGIMRKSQFVGKRSGPVAWNRVLKSYGACSRPLKTIHRMSRIPVSG